MRWFLLLYILLIPLLLVGQSAAKADDLFTKRDYLQAAQLYKELLKNRPNDALYNYRYARSNYELKEYDIAIQYFTKSGTRYPLTAYYLADSYFHTYRFDDAIRLYTTYAESTTANQAYLADVEAKLRRATVGARLMNRVEKIEFTDSIVVDKREFLKHFELSREVGVLDQKPFYKTGSGWFDLITFVTQRGDRKIFSDTTHHSIDLYKANKLLDGWAKAEPLSSVINTSADENYPFLMLDGLTLYYASNGENSLGGYDIFVTRFSGVSNDYLNPDNIGLPFNSMANDYMMVVDELNHSGWFVSDRFQPRNKVAVYRFIYTGQKQFLTNDNSREFIDAATLRTIQWSNQQEATRRKPSETTVKPEPQPVVFFVTDNLRYTSSDQFKSPESGILFSKWLNLKESTDQLNERLNELRAFFSGSKEELERATLSREMLTLERQGRQWKLQLEELEKKIRNEEIKFLKKTDVM
ncbi:MAG: hypothetical protein RBT57_08015 [Paludibacter sp.]|jgi:tetratricopeptide (TPR) repeat protein|nr:hypothetical protein [Paludibacter sp.]